MCAKNSTERLPQVFFNFAKTLPETNTDALNVIGLHVNNNLECFFNSHTPIKDLRILSG